jgi:hypothetical protein
LHHLGLRALALRTRSAASAHLDNAVCAVEEVAQRVLDTVTNAPTPDDPGGRLWHGPVRPFDLAEMNRLWERLRLAVTQLREMCRAAPPPACGAEEQTAGGGGRRRRRCRLRVAGKAVFLDGEAVPLDQTSEGREVALCYLGHLIRNGRDWISGPEIDAAEGDKGLSGQLWHRVRARLPEALRVLIETDRRKGYRLAPAAWEG